MNFENCVDTLVNHEEVQELKHPRSIKEEAEETRNETQMNKGYRKISKEEIQMEMDLCGQMELGQKECQKMDTQVFHHLPVLNCRLRYRKCTCISSVS